MILKNTGKGRHYFDWAATAIPDTFSLYDTIPFGNPSSLHIEGRCASEALKNARSRCAAVLGVPEETLYFTSGGTESNCIPIYSCIAKKSAGCIIASAGEHGSVTENLYSLERLGKITGVIPLDSFGKVSPEILSSALKKFKDVRFVSIMTVNNETGTVNDILSLKKTIETQCGTSIHMHSDMVQAAGKINIDIIKWGVDSASFSAHKIGGPRGIGLLYLRKPLEVLYSGGGQEKRIRPGTENVAGAVALAECLEKYAVQEKLLLNNTNARRRMEKLILGLQKIQRCRIIPVEREADDSRFSPYILQAAFKDIPGEVMVRALDDLGFAVSTGSACSANTPDRPVLKAMGVEDGLRLEGIRISQGWSTADDEIDLLLEAITEVLKFL